MLANLLNPVHFEALRSVFPQLDLDEIEIRHTTETDGPLGKMASVKGTIFGYPPIVHLDPADFPPGNKIDPLGIHGLVLCHELWHLVQARSFWYRFKMWFWRIMKSYEKRDHEVEAHEKDDCLVAAWRDRIRS